VGEQALPADVKFAAQIYRDADEGETKGFAYASGFVESNSARQLEARLPALVTAHDVVWTGTVERLDRMLEGAAGKMEVLIEIPDPLRGLKVGDFVSVVVLSPNASPSSVVVLPQSAVLRTAYGPFAFVLNGDHFLRTPITIGDDSGEYVEITDGLYSGDAVAARPVETLYLIELRATKGGGHCH
jgi:multidrug efflux pump subunit AcrA (membrane-fusion protein)